MELDNNIPIIGPETPPHLKEKNRAYYEANSEKLKHNQVQYRIDNHESVNEKQQQFRKRNPNYASNQNKQSRKRNRQRYRELHLKRMFGLTLERFDEIFASQGYGCAICGAKEPGGKRTWCVDHCHKTKKVRGILCLTCNVALGAFRDNPISLCAALYYLNLHGENEMELRFNAYEHDPTQGGSICFPLGDYKLEITAVEPKPVKDNPAAGYLEISLTVLEGDLRGMVQKDRLNIFNPNETAKRIAYQNLAAYAFAIERPYLQMTEQMVGGRLIATIGPQTERPEYSEVKVIKCKDGSLPTNTQKQQGPSTQAQPPAPQMPPPAAAGAPPWGSPPATQQAPPAAPPWGGNAPAPAAPAPAQTAPPWGSAPVTAAGPAAAPPWAR